MYIFTLLEKSGGGYLWHAKCFYLSIYFTIFARIYGHRMLNCNLLLDSATRFGLRKGTSDSSRDARKLNIRVSYFSVVMS